LHRRFGTKQRGIYVAAASLASGNFDVQSLTPLIEAAEDAGIPIDKQMLSHEIPVAHAILKRERMLRAADSAESLVGGDPKPDANISKVACAAKLLHPPAHPNLLQIYRFAMTMPSPHALLAQHSKSTGSQCLMCSGCQHLCQHRNENRPMYAPTVLAQHWLPATCQH